MLGCPVCMLSLEAHENAVRCSNGHHFDRARQGYLNLLPVQHKASRAPGDNAEMVNARRSFLQAGHYLPIARKLAEHATTAAPHLWLDIGCGEGYYTSQLDSALPDARGYGLDVSREAIRQACKRNKKIQWLVASMARLPLADHSCDLLTSIFSPFSWAEITRTLAPQGRFIRVGPATDHLLELRSLLYEEVRPYDDAKHLQGLPSQLQLTKTDYLRYSLTLADPGDRLNLLCMTPHGWRASAERREAILAQPLNVTVAVRFDCFARA